VTMEQSDHSWYEVENIKEIDSPALIVYPGRVVQNIRTAKIMVKDVLMLRPHVKTHKSREVVLLLLAESITKFKCATIAEAEMLAITGAPDVLLAYQPVGPKILRLRLLTHTYPQTKFSCLVDDIGAARAIADAFAGEAEPLGVFIDLNVGMNRTGILPGEQAVELYAACRKMKGIIPIGLHAYDGHIQDKDPVVRSERCNAGYEPVNVMREKLLRERFAPPIIVVGGSPTFPIHAQREGVECSPGTFVYWDKSYLDDLSDQSFLPAALLITRVISRPTADTLCLDLGHKSVAAEKDISHRVFFLNAPTATAVSQSEEHLLIRVQNPGEFAIGDVLYGLPYHICPTCALYERAKTIVEHKAEGEWRMAARDRRITA
jgi:D-threonine aldolase